MTVKVKKSVENPETTEILAAAITRIGEGMTKLLASGVNTNAIVVLLHYETKISQRDIRAIFNALGRLKGWYCR